MSSDFRLVLFENVLSRMRLTAFAFPLAPRFSVGEAASAYFFSCGPPTRPSTDGRVGSPHQGQNTTTKLPALKHGANETLTEDCLTPKYLTVVCGASLLSA